MPVPAHPVAYRNVHTVHRASPVYDLLSGRRWLRSFIEPDLFDNNVPFDNTTPIYLINLLWKLGLIFRVRFRELHYFSIFHGE